jgi:hypothetical protein
MLNQFPQWSEIGFIVQRALSQLNLMDLFRLINYFGTVSRTYNSL